MHVGICKLKLRIPENQSLKGKRMVLKSIIARVRNKFNVSIAEVEDQDVWQMATLGIACLSNDSRQANRVMSTVIDFICHTRLDVEIVDWQLEFVSSN